MKIKKKLSRKKDVVESEEIRGRVERMVSKAGGIAARHSLALIASLAVLIILSAVSLSYYYLLQKWDKEASVIENNAYEYYLEEDYKEALSKYQEISKNYASSKSMPVALYYIGNCYLKLGEIDQAIQAYQEFIERYENHEILLPLVYLNLGHAYMSKKDYGNAISAFSQASALKGSLIADRAVYETAIAYEISGDRISAMERYEYLTKTYPLSPWKQDASVKLNRAQESPVKEGQQEKPGP